MYASLGTIRDQPPRAARGATGLVDSPVGLASYLLDHDPASLEMISRSFAGQDEGLTRDDVLDNLTLFWLTSTGISAARLYRENKFAYFGAKGVSVPTAISVFPDEVYQAPRSWAEQAYPNLIHYNKVEKGDHFAAWEKPRAVLRRGSRRLPVAPVADRVLVGTCPRSARLSGSTPSHSALLGGARGAAGPSSGRSRRRAAPQPEDFAAAQPAEDHRRDHGPVPVRTQLPRSARPPRPGTRSAAAGGWRAPAAPPDGDENALAWWVAPAAPG